MLFKKYSVDVWLLYFRKRKPYFKNLQPVSLLFLSETSWHGLLQPDLFFFKELQVFLSRQVKIHGLGL